jgi:hypothetical protein
LKIGISYFEKTIARSVPPAQIFVFQENVEDLAPGFLI